MSAAQSQPQLQIYPGTWAMCLRCKTTMHDALEYHHCPKRSPEERRISQLQLISWRALNLRWLGYSRPELPE